MKDKGILTSLGIIIYIVLSCIDRFIYKIPDYLYIPMALVGLIVLIVGLIRDKRG